MLAEGIETSPIEKRLSGNDSVTIELCSQKREYIFVPSFEFFLEQRFSFSDRASRERYKSKEITILFIYQTIYIRIIHTHVMYIHAHTHLYIHT